jgi:energy-coupling factor transport system ATP-binding protein
MAWVDLAPAMMDRAPQHLSTGEKRRVALAGVMAMEPEVLVLDEPTAGLDPRGSQRIWERLFQYQRQRGIALVIVTHRLEDIKDRPDQLVVMKNGRIHRQGPWAEVLAAAEAGELEKPVMTQLFQALSQRGLPLNREALTTAEAAKAILDLYHDFPIPEQTGSPLESPQERRYG